MMQISNIDFRQIVIFGELTRNDNNQYAHTIIYMSNDDGEEDDSR